MNERGQYRQQPSRHVWGNARGQYGASLVGATLHGAMSGADAKIITDGLQSAAAEMILAMGGDPSAQTLDTVAMMHDPVGYKARFDASQARMKQSPLYPLWQSLVSPTLHDFRTEAVTGVIQDLSHWQDRMLAMRAAIDAEMKKHGMFGLRGADPAPISTSLTEDIEAAAKAAGRGLRHLGESVWGAGSDVWTFAKYGVWAVLGIGAVVALSSVASNMRSGRDPAQNYLELAKSGAHKGASAAELAAL